MSTNKYRRRRAMRTPTAGTKNQNEPIRAPLQKVNKSSSFDDLGREDARRIAEQNHPNTRYVDKPTATTSKRQLSDVMSRQQAVSEMLNAKCWETKQFHNSNHQERLLLLPFLIEWNLLSKVEVFVWFQEQT